MSAFRAVFCFELNKFFKSKGYLITTIVIMAGVVLAVFFPRIRNVFIHGDASPAKRDVIWISLSDDMLESNGDLTRDTYLQAFAEGFQTDAIEQVNKSEEDILEINRKIVALADRLGKPCVATCDVHFLDEKDAIYRQILQHGIGFTDSDSGRLLLQSSCCSGIC